ncbi:hypothetical protein C8R44DRAFT_740770 [Mycena epipterygia]|nr:hypothetical protein C8R44DRAFT_740770 [Mycena epipterygia]
MPAQYALIPDFPTGHHPIVVKAENTYNISSTFDLSQFAQANMVIPFVHRLGTGALFSYDVLIYTNTTLIAVIVPATTGTNVTVGTTNPPAFSSKKAYYTTGAAPATGGMQLAFNFLAAGAAVTYPTSTYDALNDLPYFGAQRDVYSKQTTVSAAVCVPVLECTGVTQFSENNGQPYTLFA